MLGKIFENTQVILDGHAYSQCTFKNVTFVYRGRPFDFTNNTVKGPNLYDVPVEFGPVVLLWEEMGLLTKGTLRR